MQGSIIIEVQKLYMCEKFGGVFFYLLAMFLEYSW